MLGVNQAKAEEKGSIPREPHADVDIWMALQT